MNMPLSEQAKLAAEYESSANNAVTDWATVPELVEFTYTPYANTPTQAIHHIDGNPHNNSSANLQVVETGAPDKSMTFDKIVDAYAKLKDEIEWREEKQKELKQALEAAVMLSGKEKVSCGGFRLAIITKAGAKKIMPEKLIAQGVSVEAIVNATVVAAGSQYLDVRRTKEKD